MLVTDYPRTAFGRCGVFRVAVPFRYTRHSHAYFLSSFRRPQRASDGMRCGADVRLFV